MEGLKARRGDLSGPVLAILVTLILLAIGAVIIAYFILLAGPAPAPVLVVRDQPLAYKGTGSPPDAKVEVVVANVGTASVTLDDTNTKLRIVSPSGLANAAGEASLGASGTTTIAPGESKTLTFTFTGKWSNFATYRSAGAVLILKDTASNTIGQFEVSIRIVSSS